MKHTPKTQSYGNSSFWLDWDDDDVISSLDSIDKRSYNLYKLAAAKRAISNFVNIVTNENIPVQYSSGGHSYTNGKSVTIGAKVEDPSDFDISVGLALHEGSHILLSDFELLSNLHTYISKSVTDKAISLGVPPLDTIKNILNWIEDRRIDQFIYSTSPGYKEYYRAMYDNYFNSPIIDKALKSTEYRDVTLDSYMFRLVNSINPNSDLDALPDLSKMYKLLDLKNISRFKTTFDVLPLAIDVFSIMLDNLSVSPTKPSDDDGEQSESGSDGSNSSNDSDSDENGDGDDSQSDMFSPNEDLMGEDIPSQSSSSMDTNSDSDGNGSPTSSNEQPKELKESDRKKLEKQIKKQKDFLNGDIKKKIVTKKDLNSLSAIEESGSNLVSVGSDYVDNWTRNRGAINAIIVKNMTKRLMESDVFPLARMRCGELIDDCSNEVQNGIQIGTILGKKLQIRSESKTTIFNRQKVGKIDKRMLSSLGFGNENVFKYLETDSYKKANLHISLDASGSMGGSKWRAAITNIVALCKAVDMIPNLEIQVSVRSCTTHFYSGHTTFPYIVMAYDSTVDKFIKVKQLFPYLSTSGTTPEGLAFEAILDHLKPSNQDMDSYFLNISDGMPYFTNKDIDYSGDSAAKHTSKIVKMIENKGIKILSYFVDEYTFSEVSAEFKLMYGRHAVAIDVTNVSQITKTMNDLFLQKN